MPRLVVYHDGSVLLFMVKRSHDLVGLFGHRLVQILTLLVVLINAIGLIACSSEVSLHKQRDGFLSILHATRCIDAGTNLEDNIADGYLMIRQSTYVDDSLHAHTGAAVQLAQPMVGQDAVLSHDGNNV